MEKWAEFNSVPEMKCPSLQPHALPPSLSEVDGNLFSILQTLVYESCEKKRVCLLVPVGHHTSILFIFGLPL